MIRYRPHIGCLAIVHVRPGKQALALISGPPDCRGQCGNRARWPGADRAPGARPAHGVYTLPGGVVEVGETLHEAIKREIAEETGLAIEPVALAGYRERIAHDGNGGVEQHFVILPFAARLISGELVLNEELAEARWLRPSELAGLPTTEGLAEIVATAIALMESAGGP